MIIYTFSLTPFEVSDTETRIGHATSRVPYSKLFFEWGHSWDTAWTRVTHIYAFFRCIYAYMYVFTSIFISFEVANFMYMYTSIYVLVITMQISYISKEKCIYLCIDIVTACIYYLFLQIIIYLFLACPRPYLRPFFTIHVFRVRISPNVRAT